MAVKDHVVLAKLSGNPEVADLNVIKRAVLPGHRGWSSDWEHDNRRMFDLPQQVKLLRRHTNLTRTAGYGEDIGYSLTPRMVELVQQHRQDRAIYHAVRDIIHQHVFGEAVVWRW